ncbi:MAG: histidine phosphatase family protein [Alphaproteobacteria bacterium]|nr:histidine phosphatase family protein [Alphaproteobacteria bacterium]
MIPARHFYMIRHGETEANKNRIMAGSLDSPLTELGRKQADEARLIVEQLEIKPSAIIHSHLSRARDTAHIINKNLDLPMTEERDFAEIHVGELEGARWEDCICFDEWRDPPGGETFPQFFERIRRAKKKALENKKGPVLIVCHGGVFKALWKMHGINMDGVRNCHLHEFMPAPDRKPFPWLTHFYDYNDGPIKSEADY